MKFDEIVQRYVERRPAFDAMDRASAMMELRNWNQDLLAALEQDESVSAERRADLRPFFKKELWKLEAGIRGHEQLVSKVMSETFERLSS